MKAQQFRATIEGRGPNGAWAHLPIPFNVHEAFGSRAIVPVCGTVNGHPFRSSLHPRGEGMHYLMMNKEMLAGSGAAVGTTVSVEMSLDTEKRTVAPPPELAAALKTSPEAARLWKELAPSHRKEYAEWVAGAKKQETRDNRAAKAIAMLAAGQRALR